LSPLAGEKLTAFVELESATRAFVEYIKETVEQIGCM
jgi:hypothetical protein